MTDPSAAGDLVEVEHVDEVEVVVDDTSDRDTVAYVTGTTQPREKPRWLPGALGIDRPAGRLAARSAPSS